MDGSFLSSTNRSRVLFSQIDNRRELNWRLHPASLINWLNLAVDRVPNHSFIQRIFSWVRELLLFLWTQIIFQQRIHQSYLRIIDISLCFHISGGGEPSFQKSKEAFWLFMTAESFSSLNKPTNQSKVSLFEVFHFTKISKMRIERNRFVFCMRYL